MDVLAFARGGRASLTVSFLLCIALLPDIAVRQQILRLVVKEVLVGTDTITLRHSIPIPQSGPGSSGAPNPPASVTGLSSTPNYLLRSGSGHRSLGRTPFCLRHLPFSP